MRASFYGHGRIVTALLAAGAAIDAPDAEGNTALHHAGRGGQEWVFDLLELKHRADSTVQNALGKVPAVQDEPCSVQ
eukprot:scaffold30494_cov72-Phaeocystis_antarctica.AAC.1